MDSRDPARHNETQAAYRILVASSAAVLEQGRGDVWGSGRVASHEYMHATYAGKPLQSHTTYFWKVCICDGANPSSTCGTPSHWTTAILHREEWVARWIAAKPDGPLEPQAREGVGDKHMTPETLPLFRHSFQLTQASDINDASTTATRSELMSV